MKFLRKWLASFKPVFIDDEYFGRLQLIKGKIATRNYWKGSCWFQPLARVINVTVHTIGEAPPNAAQRAFFQRLQADYPALCARCKTELEEELREWKDDYSFCCPENSLKLRGLNVPLEFDEKTTWEVSFEVDPELDEHVFTVVMRGWRAETVAVAS